LRLLKLDDVQDVLQGERLEIQTIAGVIVRGDGLRVAVGHDRLIAQCTERHGSLGAAIVKLYPLADPVRAAAQYENLAPLCGLRLADGLVGAVKIWCPRRKLGGTGIHAAVDGRHAQRQSAAPDFELRTGGRNKPRDKRIRHAVLFRLTPAPNRHIL